MSKKIVVVGGGYAGTEVIRQLRRKRVKNIEVELISNRRFFENLVGGTEIISGKLTDEELTYDLEKLADYWDFELTIGNVEKIDLLRKKININEQPFIQQHAMAHSKQRSSCSIKGLMLM